MIGCSAYVEASLDKTERAEWMLCLCSLRDLRGCSAYVHWIRLRELSGYSAYVEAAQNTYVTPGKVKISTLACQN